MVPESLYKVTGGAPLMKKQRLVQLFRQDYMFFQASYLVLPGREHPVVIQSTFPYCHDSAVMGQHPLHGLEILLCGPVGIVRMDSCRPKGSMIFYKVIYLPVLFAVRSGKDAAYLILPGFFDDPLRFRKLPAKQIQTNIIIFYRFHIFLQIVSLRIPSNHFLKSTRQFPVPFINISVITCRIRILSPGQFRNTV